ncbi:hypothetical protein BGZ47_005391 [Haplosporangium gracile]|nr:hypothetical protein BGZ47_005391 [Haplosporangium gracile]
MAPSDKVFDILELTHFIADNLSQHDLALCCLVSKSFFNTFASHLWHSITIHPNDSIPKFQTSEGRVGLLRNGHLIRVLRAYDPIALQPFIESGTTCTNLVSLDVNHSLNQFTGEVAVIRTSEMLLRGRRRGSIGTGQRQVSRAVASTLSPRTFDFAPSSSVGSGLFGAPASPSTGLFGPSVPVPADYICPSARVRICAELGRERETYLISILERNPHLEFLVVPSYCLNYLPIVKVAGELLLSLKEFYSGTHIWLYGPAIYFSLRKRSRKTLDQNGTGPEAVEGCFQSISDELLHPLLNDYPRLRDLQMGITEGVTHVVLEQIRLADKGFTCLVMTHGQPSQVTQILMRAPPLTHIVLTPDGGAYRAYDIDDNAVKNAFLRHAPTLEHFSTACCDFSKDILQTMLCSSPSLRTLKTIEDDVHHRPYKNVELDALQLTDSSWACNQLEVFECRILNVPRPDIAITPFDNLFPDLLIPPHPAPGPAAAQDQVQLSGAVLVAQQESHAVQRRVLRQLGQLIHLRKLRLGKYGRDWNMPEYSRLELRSIRTMAVDAYFDHNCLELSLESGLNELAGLKQLEELEGDQMAHRIGLVEVQWMVANWPRLRTISGLQYRDCDWEVYGDAVGGAGSLEESKPEHARWIRENRPDINLS